MNMFEKEKRLLATIPIETRDLRPRSSRHLEHLFSPRHIDDYIDYDDFIGKCFNMTRRVNEDEDFAIKFYNDPARYTLLTKNPSKPKHGGDITRSFNNSRLTIPERFGVKTEQDFLIFVEHVRATLINLAYEIRLTCSNLVTWRTIRTIDLDFEHSNIIATSTSLCYSWSRFGRNSKHVSLIKFVIFPSANVVPIKAQANYMDENEVLIMPTNRFEIRNVIDDQDKIWSFIRESYLASFENDCKHKYEIFGLKLVLRNDVYQKITTRMREEFEFSGIEQVLIESGVWNPKKQKISQQGRSSLTLDMLLRDFYQSNDTLLISKLLFTDGYQDSEYTIDFYSKLMVENADCRHELKDLLDISKIIETLPSFKKHLNLDLRDFFTSYRDPGFEHVRMYFIAVFN